MTHLSPATVGTLRERFIEDMNVRGFTDKTRKDYLRTVAGFAAFLERSPSSATAEDGVNICVIPVLLGHAKLDDTALYTRVATKVVRTVTSPLDKIMTQIGKGATPSG